MPTRCSTVSCYEDWLLPNIVELGTIWNGVPFPGPTSDLFGLGRYWTSSTDLDGRAAWYAGLVAITSKDDPDTRFTVRAVRGGR
jgi:hypothetical protein